LSESCVRQRIPPSSQFLFTHALRKVQVNVAARGGSALCYAGGQKVFSQN